MQTGTFSENARWIGLSRVVSRTTGGNTPSLRGIKSFVLGRAPKSASVRVSGLGAFVLYINGRRVGDEVLSPAFTDYQKTVLFCEYDVTELLIKGKNTVAIEVGAGFFNQSTNDVWSFAHAPWRDGEKFILSLISDWREVLFTDRTWRLTNSGPRYHTAIRQGEYYDATLEDGWLDGGFDASSWSCAALVSPPGGILVKQALPPIRICETVRPVSRKRGKNGIIFDFGRNISGVCRIKMSAPRGTQIKLSYGEQLTEGKDEISKYGISMHVDCKEIYTDKYTFRGEGTESFAPEFVYHGFQFAEVSGAEPAQDEIEALFIHTDLCDKGSFYSSDSMFNWLISATNTSFLSNFHGFSEDCPHREKNGWTGDAVISVHHAVYRYEMKEAYKKWLRDIVDTQLPSGQISCIAPTGGWGYVWGCGPAWDSALFAIPEAIYRETGDTECFDTVFDAAEKYLEYAKQYEDADGLVLFGLGDWCPPRDSNGNPCPVVSNEFSDCCQYLNMLRIMSLMCKTRGEDEKADMYSERAARLLSATRKKYVRGDDVDNSTASARAIAIYYGIVEGDTARAVADKLAEQTKAAGYTVLCGILGMKAFFSALSEHGHIDTVNKFVHCEEYPSYGFWRKSGATSLWESWSEQTTSRNHHMYSEVARWIYRYIGGIRNDGIAYDKCTFAPYIFADKASASSSTETPRGKLSIAWSYENGKFKAALTVPDGTEATLRVKGVIKKLGTGSINVELDV